MKRPRELVKCLGVLPVVVLCAVTAPAQEDKLPLSGEQPTHVLQPRHAVAATTLAPALSFEKTPAGSDAEFIARGRGTVTLKKNSAVLTLSRKPPSAGQAAWQDVRIEFAGASAAPAISGEEELPGKVYYASGNFLGPLTGNPTFRRVRYSELYRGIDAVFYGNDREVEFDFQVAPYADASQIRLSLAGADKITLEPSGDLSLVAGGEHVRLKKPVIYQQRDGIRTEIAGGYRLSRKHSEVRFELGPYDRTLPLIIDPTVLFATYFGGAGNEFIVQVKANSNGEVYLFGNSNQPSTLPPHLIFNTLAQPGVLQCFLTKLAADGSTALYTVVFGSARCGAMEVTDTGKVHVSVGSPGPTFIGTLNESTMTLGLLQGSYTVDPATHPGFGVQSMRRDSIGNLYLIVSSNVFSTSFEFLGLSYELQKVAPTGQLLGKIQLLFAPLYSDFSIPDQVGGGLPGALDVDDAGHAYVIGLVRTPGVITPTANAFRSTMLVKQAPYTDYRSDFLMRVNTTTATFQIDYATFFGGSQDDPVSAVAFDPSSNDVVVSGATNSPDFPTTPGTFAPAYDVVNNPGYGFLLKFDLSRPPAQQLIYGTFLSPYSYVYSLTMLPGGLPVVAGDTTDSAFTPFPLVNSLYPPQFTNKNRQFLSVFSPDATSLMFSTFLDSAPASQSFWPLLATNGVQTLYAATSTNFPGLSTSLAFQPSIAGGFDLFVRALDASELVAAASSRADLSLTATASPDPVTVGSLLTYSIAVTNLGPQPADTVSFTFGLPANVRFQSVTPGQGSCQTPAVGSTGTITCSLGTIASGAAVQLPVSVTAQTIGTGNSSPNVNSSTPDPNFANNTVNVVTTVSAASNQFQLTTATTGSGSGSVTALPSGTSCGVNCMAYASGTTVQLTATASAGSSFTGFTGGGCGSTNPCSLTITASTTVTATFTISQYQLTTAATGNGSGSVTLFPSGVSCGVNCTTYNYGTTVSVTATPGTGSSFIGFSGGECLSANPCSLTITGSTFVAATFTLNQYDLTTSTAGNGSGSVTVSPGGVSCGVNCTTYDFGTTVTVTATPSPDSFFVGFNGSGCGSTNPCSVTITGSTDVTATFFLIQLTTATIGSGSGTVTVSPSGVSCGVNCMIYDAGTTVTVTATPGPGSTSVGFGFSGGGCSSTNPCSFTITSATDITATFALASPVTGFEGYLYASVDVTDSFNRIYGFKVASDGTLTSLGPPVGVGDLGSAVFGSQRLAYDQHHKRLYALHNGFHYVSTHVVDLGSGILTLETGPGVAGRDCVALHPGGSPLVVGDGAFGFLFSFTEPGHDPWLGSNDKGFYTGTARPFTCVFSQDGKFVYTGGNGTPNGGGTTIAGFSVNSSLNALLPLLGSPFDVGSSVAAPYATDSTGRLFAADFFGGLLRVFTTSDGVPTAVNASPFSSGISRLTHAVLHPAGLYMLADFDGDRIGVFQVSGSGEDTTLAAVSGSPFPSGGTGPRLLALNDTGDFLFAANSTSHNITSFAVDASGQLTSIGTLPLNALGTVGVVTGLAFVSINQPVTSPPSFAKAFGATTIPLGANTTLTFTLSNPNAWYVSGVGFTDPLPAGMIVANPSSVKNTCGGTVTVAGDLRSITLANGTIPTSGGCSVVVTITGTGLGAWTNVTGNVVSAESGAGGSASATLNVVTPQIDYTITATPLPSTLLPSATETSEITLQSRNGISEVVSLSADWVETPGPTGVSPTFSPNSPTFSPNQVTVPAGGPVSATLTLTATASPSQGTFHLQIHGISASGVMKSVLLAVTIEPPPPPSTGCCTGPYVDPEKGEGISSQAGSSPSGTYKVEATAGPSGLADLIVRRTSDNHIVLSGIQAAFWGFSPDDDRFVTHWVQDPGGTSIDHVALYNLTGPMSAIWSSNEPTHSSRIQFSPSGAYLFYTYIGGGPQTRLTLVDAQTGTVKFTDAFSPAAGAPIADQDSFGTAGWGFGPNDSRFVYAYVSAQTPQTVVEWNLVNLQKGPAQASVKGVSLINETAAYWQFNPCGEVIALVHQPGQQSVQVDLYHTTDGTSAGAAQLPTPVQSLQLKTTSTSQVATVNGSQPPTTLGTNDATCSVAVQLHSPANILLVDEQGRRIGFDAATGSVVNEIPGGSYTGIGSEPQTITIPYVAGTYLIDVFGLDSLASPEPFRLTVATATSSNVIDVHELSGMAAMGSRQRFVLVIDESTLIGSFLSVDTTPPVITPNITGTLGSNGWFTSDVLASWNVTDPESSIVSSTGCVPVTVTLDTAGETFTCTATSAGGTASSSVTIKRDTAPPTITCASPDGQWHASDVSLACSASDSQSGLANAADAAFLLTTHVEAGVETSNAATDSHQVCDKAGNCATAGPFGGSKVDKKTPSIVITAPAGTYVLGQAVAASYSCADGGSGVASCSGPMANGANVNTQTVGAKSFTVSSNDNVGNGSSAVAHYNVAYNICPLYTTVAKHSGSSYPIKIQLCDANGINVSASSIVVHAVSVTHVSANTPATLDDTGNANPDFDFRYDTTLNGYIFNLGTKGYASGTYTLNFTAGDDPTLHSAQFAVK